MAEYREEVPLDSFIAVKDLKSIIEEIIDGKLKKARFDRKFPAIVSSTPSGGYCDIQLQGSTNSISNVKIRDGLTIAYSDEVYITAINGSLNNIFIDLKK